MVTSRHPLWDEHPIPIAESGSDVATRAMGVSGALAKEMPVTEGLDAWPQDTLGIPSPTYVPLAVAAGVTLFFVGLLVNAAVIGVIGVAIGLAAVMLWTWRTSEELR